MPLFPRVFVKEVVLIVVFLCSFPLIKRLLPVAVFAETPSAMVERVCLRFLRLVAVIEIFLHIAATAVCLRGFAG